jgi:hypothetical protein
VPPASATASVGPSTSQVAPSRSSRVGQVPGRSLSRRCDSRQRREGRVGGVAGRQPEGRSNQGSVPVESTVSPDSGTANAGGDTVDVGSGGGGSPDALKKKAKTKAQKCADAQRSYEGLIAARNQAKEGSDDYKFLDAMARSSLQNAVDMGCFDF